jgi:hypothetical protein
VAAQGSAAGRQGSELGILLATYVVLLAIGALLGVIETFLVPQRLFGGVEGLSAVLALLGNAAVGSFGGIGTRTMAGAVAPIIGWFITVGILSVVAPGGDVVLAGKLPSDPGVVVAGTAFLFCGVIGSAVALVVTVRYTKRGIAPTPLT